MPDENEKKSQKISKFNDKVEKCWMSTASENINQQQMIRFMNMPVLKKAWVEKNGNYKNVFTDDSFTDAEIRRSIKYLKPILLISSWSMNYSN